MAQALKICKKFGVQRRLILHVGPGRTETSALQTMFCIHADYLAAQGVHFPRWPGFEAVAAGGVGSGNGGPIAALIGNDKASRHYTREDGLVAMGALHETHARTVLYSSEAMALFERERLSFLVELAASAGFVIQAVYYLREESNYARSIFARATAMGKISTPQERFLHKYVPPFARHLRELREVLGANNVIVRDYDFAKDDLFADFCVNVLGIDRPDGRMAWINSSASQVPYSGSSAGRNKYQDEASIREKVAAGLHREIIGGMWDEVGQLQFDFLCAEGLRPQHRFLDIGCGAMRAGVKVAPYLDRGNYYGIDVSAALIEAGLKELASVGAKVPIENVRATGRFDVSGFPEFDYAIAQSVFTHLPLSMLADCLRSIRVRRLYATFFVAPPSAMEWQQESGKMTFANSVPYHASVEAIRLAANSAGWACRWIGDWGHPRCQQIAEFNA